MQRDAAHAWWLVRQPPGPGLHSACEATSPMGFACRSRRIGYTILTVLGGSTLEIETRLAHEIWDSVQQASQQEQETLDEALAIDVIAMYNATRLLIPRELFRAEW